MAKGWLVRRVVERTGDGSKRSDTQQCVQVHRWDDDCQRGGALS